MLKANIPKHKKRAQMLADDLLPSNRSKFEEVKMKLQCKRRKSIRQHHELIFKAELVELKK